MPIQPKLQLTKVLLTVVADVAGSAVDLAGFFAALQAGYGSAYHKGGAGYVAELRQFRHPGVAQAAFRNLKRSNFITTRPRGDKVVVALTDKGRSALLVQELRRLEPRRGPRATVVIFDVPQRASATRRQFRWLLRQGGFTKLQQSVWVGPVPAYELVARFIRQEQLEAWVNVFRADSFLVPPRSS